MAEQRFGGDWTEDKLQRIRKYLSAYTQIMKDRQYTFAYIDAFAGTGYRESGPDVEAETPMLFPELFEEHARPLRAGSARVALEVEPRFQHYIFIEKDPARFAALDELKTEYSHLASSIQLENEDANPYLNRLCSEYNWSRNRAVVFLDPYGMQVDWNTIQAIADTEAIDLWYLFPWGIAANRLLRRDGNIPASHRERLNSLFGDTEWFDAFYRQAQQATLFGPEDMTVKHIDAEGFKNYLLDRLRTVFPLVAPNPLALRNSRNNPLYILCFAAANPRARAAIKIAEHILGQ